MRKNGFKHKEGEPGNSYDRLTRKSQGQQDECLWRIHDLSDVRSMRSQIFEEWKARVLGPIPNSLFSGVSLL